MSSNTKILVLKARELIYTLIFAVLGIALVMLLIYMFSDKNENGSSNGDSTIQTPESATDTENNSESSTDTEKDSETSTDTESSSLTSSDEISAETASAIITTTTYVPGTYEAPINLGGTILNLEVYVDDTCIPTASITNLDESTKEMYPLIEPALAEINNQLAEMCTPDEITYSHDNKYTSLVIIDAIRTALLD